MSRRFEEQERQRADLRARMPLWTIWFYPYPCVDDAQEIGWHIVWYGLEKATKGTPDHPLMKSSSAAELEIMIRSFEDMRLPA